ncbi:MAG: peroxiredoxin [Chloroflexi bacterium]|nr:peroxiredoxin [Chloroflexota bacterium]
MRDDRARFEALGATVLAVNPGSLASHGRFADKYQLPFPLLADTERKAATAYGVLKPNGKSIQRTVVVLDKEGVVRYVKQGMPSTQELLEVLEKL